MMLVIRPSISGLVRVWIKVGIAASVIRNWWVGLSTVRHFTGHSVIGVTATM